MHTDFHTMQYKLRRNLRPIKIAYFIRDDDPVRLRSVIKLSGTQWGGIRNLIVCMDKDGGIDDFSIEALKVCEPDYIVNAVPQEQTLVQASLHHQLGKLWFGRGIYIRQFDSFVQRDPSIHSLRALSPELLRNNILKAPIFSGSALDRLMLLALFGAFFPGQAAYYRNNVRVERDTVGIHDSDFWTGQYHTGLFSSILNLTGYNIGPHSVKGGFGRHGFNIVVGNSISSICTFWNLRSLSESSRFPFEQGRTTLLMPSTLLKDIPSFQIFLDFILANIKDALPYVNLHLNFTVPDELVSRYLQRVLLEFDTLVPLRGHVVNLNASWTQKYGAASNRIPKRLTYIVGTPLKFRISIPQSFKEGVHDEEPLWTPMNFGGNDLLIQAPQSFNNPDNRNCILDLESTIWETYPKRDSIAEAIRPGSRFTRYGLTMDVALANRPGYIEINLPTEWEALSRYFGDYGYDISLSPDGKYATSFVSLIGGFGNLQKLCRPESYRILLSLTPRSPKKLAQHIVQQVGAADLAAQDYIDSIAEAIRTSDITLDFHRKPKTSSEISQVLNNVYGVRLVGDQLFTTLQDLVDSGVLKRGYFVSCPRCATQSWHAIAEINEVLTCPGCLNGFPFPVNSGNSDLKWHFRLNTLVSQLMDQDGLPALFSLHHLAKAKSIHCQTLGLLLTSKTDPNLYKELDFVFVSKQELYAGECKAGSGISDKDIERARFAATLGVQHFYFCTLEQFDSQASAEILRLQQELSDQGCEILTLTGTELFGE